MKHGVPFQGPARRDSMIVIFTIAHMPDEETGKRWLQHMRDFDTANDGCHFQVLANAPDLNLDQVKEMLNISPGFDLRSVFTLPAVHILHHGLPICGFTRLLPRDWPSGHSWVGFDEKQLATCAGCKAIAESPANPSVAPK